MSWLTDERGCGNCRYCSMDMDMEPFCKNPKNYGALWGLYINFARAPWSHCGPDGKLFEERRNRDDEDIRR